MSLRLASLSMSAFMLVNSGFAHRDTILADKINRNHVAYIYSPFRCSIVSMGSNLPQNQDAFIAKENLFGVCDGHGGLGHEISSHIKNKLSSRNVKENLEEIEKELQQDYLNLDLENYPEMLFTSRFARRSILAAQSGSTVCVGRYDNKKDIWEFANLGDSQAIYINPELNLVVDLTYLENIRIPGEQKKLFEKHPKEDPKKLSQYNNRYVMGRLQPTSVIGDFYLKESLHTIKTYFDPVVGPHKIHNSNDYISPPYIRSEPSYRQFSLNLDKGYIIFATDGFWDRLCILETLQHVKKFEILKSKGDINESLASFLAHIALSRPCLQENALSTDMDWNIISSEYSRDYRDDVTIVVVNK